MTSRNSKQLAMNGDYDRWVMPDNLDARIGQMDYYAEIAEKEDYYIMKVDSPKT